MKSLPKLNLAFSVVLATLIWATTSNGVAQTHGQRRTTEAQTTPATGLPSPVSIQVDRREGLMVDAWVNQKGPYRLAVDTGAGTTILSSRVATAANINYDRRDVTKISGITGSSSINGSAARLQRLALGDPQNMVSSNHQVIISDSLPGRIDGILDPTEAFWPFGYAIDIPGKRLEAFDAARDRVTMSEQPPGGTVVRWIMDNESRRPFVRLGDGRLALIDTGSSFGLAVSASEASVTNHKRGPSSRDIGGGDISSAPTQRSTVSIGSLTLRGVPTNVLFRTEPDAPVLLGREVLYPMKLVFDPLHRLIAIQPAS